MEVGHHPEIILAGRRINDNMGNFIAEKTISELAKQGISPLGANIAILGLSFKEDCPDIRNTKVVSIIRRLEDYNCNLTISDPNVMPKEAEEQFGIKLHKMSQIKKQDSIILAVAHKEYMSIKSEDWERLLKPNGVVVDIKSIFERDYFSNLSYRYWAL